ncbi:MAG TPA: LuxR C-terminal-related transcriptional regulator [Chloroflexota bacterium]
MRPTDAAAAERSELDEAPAAVWRGAEAAGNLPLQATRFVGRERDVEHLRGLLGSARLLTLTGAGGIGKTRLALEVARAPRVAYRDGVWLVDLAPVAEPDLVAHAVAGTLGLRAETELSVQAALVEFLSGRHVLLVIDNCEHLVDASAHLIEAVLRACPEVSILATSRESLHITGGATWRVAPLPEAEAVRLFADRAQAISGLEVTASSTPSVVRVCQQVDCIPLAIELAAARTGVLSVDQIATRLDNRFRLLTGGGRAAPARQQTLRATIDWSYELLPRAERRLLNRLSVFAGDWSLEAAERVGAETGSPGRHVLEALARLVDKSLVQVEARPGGHVRYRLLESVRAYAAERLREDGEAADVQQRHCAYYSALAQEAEAQVLWGPHGLDWLVRLDGEQSNLRAALGWSLSEGGDASAGLRLAGCLGHYWYTRGDRSEGHTWLTRALARVPSPTDASDASDVDERRAWAWAVLWAGGLAHGRSDYDQATRLMHQAMRAFERLDDQRGLGWCLHFLGHVARARSELPQAEDLLEGSIAAFRGVGDEISVILPLAALGFTVCLLGDPSRATELCEEAVHLARETGASGRLALALIYQGQVASLLDRPTPAANAFLEGLRVAREWDSAWGMAECLEGLAVVASGEGQPERAARLLGAAARLRQAIGAPVHPVDRADHERAVEASRSALGLAEYASAWESGQQLGVDEVIACAALPDTDAAAPSTAGEQLALLTTREREVAVLIARGLSNRQIAAELVIAERTVTNHVEHIFDKLGFRSRAQVAAWITEHQRT